METLGHVRKVADVLAELGMQIRIFTEVKPAPDLATVYAALESVRSFQPGMFIALGGGFPWTPQKSSG